ncbi:MAG: AAA family ATPase [Bacteroidales bacterium]|nr:AAA family ATPase [Bacteroidales bacterium]
MEQNILKAFNAIVTEIRNFKLNPFDPALDSAESVQKEIGMLREALGLTALQVALLGLSIEGAAGKNITFLELADTLNCSYLELMSHADEFLILRKKGYLRISEEKISIPAEAMAALMKNQAYTRAEPKGMSTEAQLAKIRSYLGKVRREQMAEELFVEEADLLIRSNPESSLGMAFSKHIAPLRLPDQERYLFYLALYGARFHGNQFSAVDVQDYFSNDSGFEEALFWLENCHDCLALFKSHIFEEVSVDGLAEEGQFKIRNDIVEDFLKEATPFEGHKIIWLEDSAKYTPKELFYNEAEKQQVQRLSSLLSPANLHRVFESMEAKGMCTGFTCLFFGAPGTGKTETALQLARATGRKVLCADIAQILSKWVGESDQNARRLFRDYRKANEGNELSPILLLNEADAFLGKRFENVRNTTEKMGNGLQNIFLEELERFSGILIATTNLTSNLDPAFDRRFLFKIRFDKPCTEVSASIWRSIIPELSEGEALQLATEYDFSGGQIENIARKRNLDAILNGSEPDFAAIRHYCDEETIANRPFRRAIGF